MGSINLIQETWQRFVNEKEHGDDKDFVIKWCESLTLALALSKDDYTFKSDILFSAVDFFENSLSDEDKRDAFFYCLRIITSK